MAINFPTSLDNFTNPSSGNTLDSPSHSLQHSDINDAVEAMQRKVGVGTAVAGSATSGQVLTASTGGTTTWTTPTVPGLEQIVPTSVAVGLGSGSSDALGNVTFTGASSVSVNGCFTSVYDNYKVFVYVDGMSASVNNLFFQFGTNGTANANANYTQNGYYQDTTGNPLAFYSNNGTSYSIASAPSLNTSGYASVAEIMSPFESTRRTVLTARGVSFAHARDTTTNNTFTANTSFTDLRIFTSSGNITTGTIRVYGYRD